MRRHVLLLLILVGSSYLLPTLSTAAFPIALNDALQRAWDRTDKPVADGRTSRTWMWGPEAHTTTLREPYANAPGKWRTVQYFDKSRMEITHPGANPDTSWYVTNGLLAQELITGHRQVGDSEFQSYAPADVNVAGDVDDPGGPTYATFTSLLTVEPTVDGALLTERLTRQGVISDDPSLGSYEVTTARYVAETQHQIATPFWAFMVSEGTIYDQDDFISGPLFENPFYATGFPITEAYWATVRVGGTPKDVLMQCFERRCLTYTPDNPEGWQVEAGNVGRHYYAWLYEQVSAEQLVIDGVPAEQEAIIRDATALAQEYIGPVGPALILASTDLGNVVRTYMDVNGISAEAYQQLYDRWAGQTGEAGHNNVIIYTPNLRWEGSSGEQMWVIVHEYFHLFQNARARQRLMQPDGSVPSAGPVWLIEGGADYATAQGLDDHQLADYDDVWLRMTEQARMIAEPLSSLEARDPTRVQDPYILGFLASDLLVSRYGAEAYLEYWSTVGTGVMWKEAFATTFGSTIAEFYAEFEAYRLAAFPPAS